MNITDIKKLNVGVKGLTVVGKLLNCYPPKDNDGQYGKYTSQKVQLIEDDTDEKIIVWIGNGFVSKEDIGKDIEISDCGIKKYKEELQLGTASSSAVKMKRDVVENPVAEVAKGTPSTKTEKPRETVAFPRTFEGKVTSAIEEVSQLLKLPGFKTLLEEGVNLGLSSEDVRAMVISRMIQKGV